MRILAVADLHYRLRHYDWLVTAAADVDVVVVAGDLADVANPVPLPVQVVVLDTYLDRLAEQAVVLAASGNHDLDGPGGHGEQVAGWLSRPRDGSLVTDDVLLGAETALYDSANLDLAVAGGEVWVASFKADRVYRVPLP